MKTIKLDDNTMIWLESIMNHAVATQNNPKLAVKLAIFEMADRMGEVHPDEHWTDGDLKPRVLV